MESPQKQDKAAGNSSSRKPEDKATVNPSFRKPKDDVSDCLISIEQIKKLLEKYAIGKKPLAKLLGWGETTVLRYLDGEIPSKEYSERLRLIAQHPEIYRKMLEAGKERITKVAYRKSRQAVDRLLFGSRLHIVAHMVRKEMKDEHGAQALQYYCYYAQVLSMYLYGKELFDEDYQTEENLKPYPAVAPENWNSNFSWDFGDLSGGSGDLFWDFEDLFWNFKDSVSQKSDDATKGCAEASKEQMLIREVVFAFRWYGLETIKSMLSHERSFLKITYFNCNYDNDYENADQKKPIITKETLKQYFKKQFDELDIKEPKDFHKYVSSMAFKLIRE